MDLVDRRFTVEALLERGELARAQALALATDPETSDHGGFARGLVAAAIGDHERAIDEFLAYGSFCGLVGWEGRDCPWRLRAALSLRALTREAEAVELVDAELVVATRWGAPGALGRAQRIRALLLPPDQQAAASATAVATLRGSALRLVLAAALHDHGTVLHRTRETEKARTALAEARRLALRCEAGPLVERLDADIASLGQRHRQRLSAPPTPAAGTAPTDAPATPGPASASLERRGEFWRVRFSGEAFFVRHGKGMAQLARLLALPGVEVRAVDLAAGEVTLPHAGLAADGGPGSALGAQEKARFRQRLDDLDTEIDEARERHDEVQLERLDGERRELAVELARAVGLADELRPAPIELERARVNVTRTLRGAIDRLAAIDPALGLHLEATLRTGAWCVHRPELGTASWTVHP